MSTYICGSLFSRSVFWSLVCVTDFFLWKVDLQHVEIYPFCVLHRQTFVVFQSTLQYVVIKMWFVMRNKLWCCRIHERPCSIWQRQKLQRARKNATENIFFWHCNLNEWFYCPALWILVSANQTCWKFFSKDLKRESRHGQSAFHGWEQSGDEFGGRVFFWKHNKF